MVHHQHEHELASSWFSTGVRLENDVLLPLRSKGKWGEGESFVPGSAVSRNRDGSALGWATCSLQRAANCMDAGFFFVGGLLFAPETWRILV